MSTQRAAATAGRVRYGRYHTLKGVAFWGFLFTASFVFGMLVVSPLLTAAGVGDHKESPSPSSSGLSQPPPPQPNSPAAANIPQSDEKNKPAKVVAPDIELSVEPTNRSSQNPESLESANKDTTENPKSPSTSTHERQTGTDEESAKPRRALRTRQGIESPENDVSGTYTTEPDKQLVPERSPSTDVSDRPRVRSHRPTHNTKPSVDTSRPAPKEKNSEVQKGEPIDP
jgi:hypothetical protein